MTPSCRERWISATPHSTHTFEHRHGASRRSLSFVSQLVNFQLSRVQFFGCGIADANRGKIMTNNRSKIQNQYQICNGTAELIYSRPFSLIYRNALWPAIGDMPITLHPPLFLNYGINCSECTAPIKLISAGDFRPFLPTKIADASVYKWFSLLIAFKPQFHELVLVIRPYHMAYRCSPHSFVVHF